MVAVITTEEYDRLIRTEMKAKQIKKVFEVKENVVKVNTNMLSEIFGLSKDATFVFVM